MCIRPKKPVWNRLITKREGQSAATKTDMFLAVKMQVCLGVSGAILKLLGSSGDSAGK